MPYSPPRLLAVIIAAATSGSLLASANSATLPIALIQAEADADAIKVEQAWARASAGNATTGAAYLTLIGGTLPDRLIGVTTEVAAAAAVHESVTDNGVMTMRPVPNLPILPGQTVSLAPGGYHVMMMGLKHPLMAGRSFPLTLRFEHARPITIEVQIRPIGQAGATGNSSGGRDQMHMQ